jgi:hypothetical protein
MMKNSQSGTVATVTQEKTVLMGSGLVSPTIKAHLAKSIAAQQTLPSTKTAPAKSIVLTGSGLVSPTIKAHLAKQFR